MLILYYSESTPPSSTVLRVYYDSYKIIRKILTSTSTTTVTVVLVVVDSELEAFKLKAQA